MSKRINMIGLKFGKLKVIKDSGRRTKRREIIWTCICDCGNLTEVRGWSLRNGEIVSCGCYHIELFKLANEKRHINKSKKVSIK